LILQNTTEILQNTIPILFKYFQILHKYFKILQMNTAKYCKILIFRYYWIPILHNTTTSILPNTTHQILHNTTQYQYYKYYKMNTTSTKRIPILPNTSLRYLVVFISILPNTPMGNLEMAAASLQVQVSRKSSTSEAVRLQLRV